MLGFLRSRPKSKEHRQTVKNDALELLRDQEAAFVRFQDGNPEPSDSLLLHGTDYQKSEKKHRDRLQGVNTRRASAGTKEVWHSTNAKLAEMRPRVTALLEKNNAQIERLQEQMNRLRAENAEAAGQLNTLQTAVNDMTAARDRLRSPEMLPEVLHREIDVLVRLAREKSGHWPELKSLLSDLSHFEKIGTYQGAAYAGAAASPMHQDHPGHDFWRNTEYGPGMWSAYEEWVADRVPVMQARVKAIEATFDPELVAQINELRDFYIADLV